MFLAGAGAACAALAAGCQEVGDYTHQLASQSGGTPSTYDGVAQPVWSAEAPPKLPPKDAHSFGIGAVLPLHGPRAASGRAMQRGLELAVAEVNAAGGVNGQPIQLDAIDGGADSSSGAIALGALRDHGEAVLLVGDAPLAITQAETLAEWPQLIGFLCDYVPVPRLTPKNGVRLYLNGDQEANAIEGYIEAAGVERVAVIHQNDLTGTSHSQYLAFLFSGNHRIYTTDEAYGAGERDFALLAKAMMSVNNGAIVLAGDGPEYANLLAAFDAAGWKGQVFGYASVTGLADLSSTTGLAATAAYPLPDFAANPRSTESGRAFADAYRAKYGEDPPLAAAYAYDNIRALAAAAQQAATSDPLKIRAGFLALKSYTGAAGRYEIKDDGDTAMPLRLLRADGQPLPAPSKAAEAPAGQTIHLPTPEIILPGGAK